ncbi:MAG: IS66 family insertion sequence element accessory protein TnpB, partial [Anderseniella sp.]
RVVRSAACSVGGGQAMMRPSNDLDAVWLTRDPVDFRKGINGLSVLVEEQLMRDPFCGQLFVFVNKARDKIKILYWERAGFCMWQKRLEKERFKWPEHLDGDVMTLDGQQLNWLLDGYDLAAMRPHRLLCYRTVL